jgi:hypothetical protein
MKLGGLFVCGLIAAAGCDRGVAPAPPTYGGELEPAGLLYQGPLWTKPEGAQFDAQNCKSRPSLPGCEDFRHLRLVALAIDGRRLVALMETIPWRVGSSWDLLLSDDLGQTVRRSPFAPSPGGGGAARLYFRGGRIFVLAEADDPRAPGRAGARVFEVDPVRGTWTALGREELMSSVAATAAADGTLTSVAFGRNQPPQVLSVTRFHPASGAISHAELPCTLEGCEPSSLSQSFLSDDGNAFDLLVAPEGALGRTCVLSVDARTQAVESRCSSAFASDDLRPISSFGGQPYDFQLSMDNGDPAWMVPVTRHWIPAGPRLMFGPQQLQVAGGSFFVFSPSGRAVEGDSVLLRLRPGGRWQRTELAHSGCLDLGFFGGRDDCPQVISLQALSGDELLLVTQRDEFQEAGRSRDLFQVIRSAAPFTDFQLPQ